MLCKSGWNLHKKRRGSYTKTLSPGTEWPRPARTEAKQKPLLLFAYRLDEV